MFILAGKLSPFSFPIWSPFANDSVGNPLYSVSQSVRPSVRTKLFRSGWKKKCIRHWQTLPKCADEISCTPHWTIHATPVHESV